MKDIVLIALKSLNLEENVTILDLDKAYLKKVKDENNVLVVERLKEAYRVIKKYIKKRDENKKYSYEPEEKENFKYTDEDYDEDIKRYNLFLALKYLKNFE